jgi:hypothetical protein
VRRLWAKVSDAIAHNDQTRATEEKFVLESAQRRDAKVRAEQNIDYVPKLFKPTDQDCYFVYRAQKYGLDRCSACCARG